MDLVVHDCDDPNCDEHDIFSNAEIRRIKSATRFRTQPRDGGILDFERQLRGVKITPRKLSMVDLTNPCKHDQDDIFSGKDHFKKLRAEYKVNKTAVIQDPAVVAVGDKNSDEDTTKKIRFNEMLRKLKGSSIPEYCPVAEVKDSPKERPRQDSGDSGVDTRSPIKRSLNPLAKEFAAFSSKESPVVAEKRGSETSMNIPLSVLEQIVGQRDQFKPLEGGGQQISNEAILNTIQKFGLGSSAQQNMTSPPSFEPLSMHSALQHSLLPLVPSTASGVDLTNGIPPMSTFVPMQASPPSQSFPPFVNPTVHNLPLSAPAFGLHPQEPGLPPPMARYGPQTGGFMAGFNRPFVAGPNIGSSGHGPQTFSNFPTSPPNMANNGYLNQHQAGNFDNKFLRPQKPRIPDAMAQQKYEEYIEWKKANDPQYALECKNRQARRAIRNNPIPA
ncbi:hypothetical protein CKAH01_01073 [Colletotrichum kahawae]|uniref:Uncharacterized protein n=1 Tax=Colletotrichum kahawae TaxID=34407 RepID=A0AAD9YC07_COLKA|nr:hypothetical protein CKAH01_01073 [Colletotrichum kahawae]